MTTSVTKIGGVMVVTQVIPQDERSIQLQPADTSQTPTVTVQALPPARRPPPSSLPKVDDTTATFLRGEPQGLGVVQVVVGLLCCLFSLTSIYEAIMTLHAPFCLGIIFVVSGALTLAAVRYTSIRLVWTCLVMNAVSVLVAVLGVALACALLLNLSPAIRFCYNESWPGMYKPTTSDINKCIHDLDLLNVAVYGCLGVLLVLLVLEACVNLTTCIFSAKAIRRHSRYTPMMVEVDPSGLGSDVSLLDSEDGEISTPYSP